LNDLAQLCIKVEQQKLRKGKSLYFGSYPKKDYKGDQKDKNKE